MLYRITSVTDEMFHSQLEGIRTSKPKDAKWVCQQASKLSFINMVECLLNPSKAAPPPDTLVMDDVLYGHRINAVNPDTHALEVLQMRDLALQRVWEALSVETVVEGSKVTSPVFGLYDIKRLPTPDGKAACKEYVAKPIALVEDAQVPFQGGQGGD
jgi:hypothetical protein